MRAVASLAGRHRADPRHDQGDGSARPSAPAARCGSIRSSSPTLGAPSRARGQHGRAAGRGRSRSARLRAAQQSSPAQHRVEGCSISPRPASWEILARVRDLGLARPRGSSRARGRRAANRRFGMRVTYMISLNHSLPVKSSDLLHAYTFGRNSRNAAQTLTFPPYPSRKFRLII